MSTTIRVPPLDTLPEVRLHHLPCNIKSNGFANVDTYFKPKEETRNNGKKTLTSTFRGRPLDGDVMKVPEGFTGVVINEKRRPFSEEEDRTLDVIGKFDSFTKWHLDSKYTSTSTIDKAVNEWPKIAAAIHSPVAPTEDIKQEV